MTVTRAATKLAKTGSTLLTIPVEVRQIIYRHLFHGVALRFSDSFYEDRFGKCAAAFVPYDEDSEYSFDDMESDKDAVPFILRTSHQIRNEALPIFSSELTLCLSCWSLTRLTNLIPRYYLQNTKNAINAVVKRKSDFWAYYKATLPSLENLQVGVKNDEVLLSTEPGGYSYGDEADVLEGNHDEHVLQVIKNKMSETYGIDFNSPPPPFQLQIMVRLVLHWRDYRGPLRTPTLASSLRRRYLRQELMSYSLQRPTLAKARSGIGAGMIADQARHKAQTRQYTVPTRKVVQLKALDRQRRPKQ